MLFKEQFLEHIYSSRLISTGDKLIIAVSGGADSMALLTVLSCARRTLGLELIVAHYDHHLRSSSSHDRLFVKAAADRLGFPFVTEINHRPTPKTGSIEEFARDCRYNFLIRTAVKHKADAIVTAHTRDDLAETVLMRILRGTGLFGLQAILPRRTIQKCELIRPMLLFSRQDVETFLNELKVKFINDPSNLSLDFDRNKIRKVLIPYLEKNFHSAVKISLARLADIAAVDQSFIEASANKFLKRTVKTSTHSVSVSLAGFKRLHCSLRRTILRAMILSLSETDQALSLTHITAIDEALFEANAEISLRKRPLPIGLVCTIRSGRLILSRKNPLSYP